MANFLNNLNLQLSNPFNSAIGLKIEQATDPSLESENWALNMEICDMINESSSDANSKDAMKAIRKRLTQYVGKNYTVILLTLTVLETCVKNCGKNFHVLVANKEFIQELVKLIGPKYDPPTAVQEKVLSLIQIWADTFATQPDLKGVVEVYQELRNKGIEFPSIDPDNSVPIYTPQKSVVTAPPVAHPQPQQRSPHHDVSDSPHPSAGGVAQDQIAKLQSELDIVSMNMTILSEMLTELNPNRESPADYKLLIDLVATCKEMQTRIVDLIGKVNNDEITAELLRLNDELNNLFLRYQRYEKNKDPKTASDRPSAILGAALGVPASNSDTQKDSLIDLNDQATGVDSDLNTKFSSLSTSQLSKIKSTPAKVDEFDMLAQSRTSDGKTTTKDLDVDLLQGQTNAKPTDFDEIEEWLKAEKPAANEGEESLTSKEFDKFLAERAAVAETLPTISNRSSDDSRSKKKSEEPLMG
ncbi:CLUMA_CG009662, isoform A [Clunio marinus]|uniref:CLUMA_CG009662, isoform A n=1 Tax=Clunio marinus TaxID=568069 RepID=A0A1J1I7S0_9DIPT|nr:CLUMA_CG009662, isoform A [Clunio marinus]